MRLKYALNVPKILCWKDQVNNNFIFLDHSFIYSLFDYCCTLSKIK